MNADRVRERWKGVFVGVLVGGGVGGYLLVRGNQQLRPGSDAGGEFSLVMFVVIPILTGFSIAVVTKPPYILSGLVLTTILSLTMLIFTGLEGFFRSDERR